MQLKAAIHAVCMGAAFICAYETHLSLHSIMKLAHLLQAATRQGMKARKTRESVSICSVSHTCYV